MQYFKNVDLTKLYPVSESAVRKWIEAAKGGKLDLQLFEHNGRSHIANTARNQRIIEELVERGKKYKNTRGHKVVTPKEGFYKLYSKKQILDIISNVEIYREIPSKYGYFDGGADYWDQYTKRLWSENDANTLTSTIELLNSNLDSINSLIEDFDRVNIIDLGVGNCLPIKDFLSHLIYNQAKLSRYIGIDISSEMLDIAERNIKEWFGDHVEFERYERDFSNDQFDDLIIEETLRKDNERVINIVLLLGGTIANFRSPDDVLRVVRNSMGLNDLLITSRKPDSEQARRYFDFSVGPSVPRLSNNERFVLDLLDIDESFYEVEQGYDTIKRVRYIQARLTVDLTINFDFDTGSRKLELYKGDTLLLWRAWHQTTLEIVQFLDKNGFALLQASATKDRYYLLTISKIDSSPRSTV